MELNKIKRLQFFSNKTQSSEGGNDLTQDQLDALVGEGSPSAGNKYATKLYVDGVLQNLPFPLSANVVDALQDTSVFPDSGNFFTTRIYVESLLQSVSNPLTQEIIEALYASPGIPYILNPYVTVDYVNNIFQSVNNPVTQDTYDAFTGTGYPFSGNPFVTLEFLQSSYPTFDYVSELIDDLPEPIQVEQYWSLPNSVAGGLCPSVFQGNDPSGEASFVVNAFNVATGFCSFASGYQTEAAGIYSHNEGASTKSFGPAAHSEGMGSQAVGEASHAEGYYTIASNLYSHSQNQYTWASGESSHAGGRGASINDKNILAEGIASFNHSFNDNGQTSGHGALANYSAILGGVNSNIPIENIRSVLLGGNGLKATPNTPDTVFAPRFESLLPGEGIVMKSPNGTRWRITMANNGLPSIVALP